MQKRELSHNVLRLAGMFAVLLGLVIVQPAEALDYRVDPQADQGYQKALELYRQGRFDQAYVAFSELAADYPWDARITIFKLMEAKSLYYSDRFGEALDAFWRFTRDHPGSSFIPAVKYFLGRIHYIEHNYDSSALSFMTAYQKSDRELDKQLFLKNLRAVASGYLQAERIQKLLDKVGRYELALELTLAASEKYYRNRQISQARSLLDDLRLRFARASENSRVASLQKKLELFASRRVVLALFVPLSGEWARFGQMMSNAFDLALRQYSRGADLKLEHKKIDTYGNSIVSAIEAKNITSEPLTAIIGPLSSSEAVGVAAYTDVRQIPLVCPTASEKGLTSISDQLFQLSPTPERMGEALAEFVTSEMGFDSVAILAPLDSYGKQITDGFVHTMIDSGVDIFYQKFYPRGTRDFRRFLLDLKETVLPDTFVAEIFLNEEGDTLEVEEIPVQIPALFLPCYASELKLMLPQLRFYKINTIVLGSDSYGEDEIMAMRESEDNPVFFVSKSQYLPEDTSWLKFTYLYQKEFDEPPDRVAAVTYDAVSLVLKCVESGSYTSEEISRCLNEKGLFDGAAGEIRFNQQRENVRVPVYFLTEGEIIRLQ